MLFCFLEEHFILFKFDLITYCIAVFTNKKVSTRKNNINRIPTNKLSAAEQQVRVLEAGELQALPSAGAA